MNRVVGVGLPTNGNAARTYRRPVLYYTVVTGDEASLQLAHCHHSSESPKFGGGVCSAARHSDQCTELPAGQKWQVGSEPHYSKASLSAISTQWTPAELPLSASPRGLTDWIPAIVHLPRGRGHGRDMLSLMHVDGGEARGDSTAMQEIVMLDGLEIVMLDALEGTSILAPPSCVHCASLASATRRHRRSYWSLPLLRAVSARSATPWLPCSGPVEKTRSAQVDVVQLACSASILAHRHSKRPAVTRCRGCPPVAAP
jgi:hypothetical protein